MKENKKENGGSKAAGKAQKTENSDAVSVTSVSTKADLKNFLLNIRDKMSEGTSAAIYAASAMNHVLSMPTIYELLDKPNKEIARDIWLRLKQSGMQLRNPPMLFSPEEDGVIPAP